MDLRSILKNDVLRIKASCDYEMLFLCEDGFARDTNHNETRLRVEFIHNYYEDEDSTITTEKTIASMVIRVYKYKEYHDIYDISEERFDSIICVNTAMDYISICKKYPDLNTTFNYIDKERNITICDIYDIFIDSEYRGIGLSEYMLCMIPTILREYLGVTIGVISIDMYKFTFQKNEDGDMFHVYDEKKEKIRKIMAKSLFKTGFIEVDEDYGHYAIDLSTLEKKASALKVDTGFTGRYCSLDDE